MKLYHGTGERHLEHILRIGIVPRGHRKGNWQHTLTSNSRAVYLTTAYGIHFAKSCANTGSERMVILEVDTDLIDANLLAPDEDFLEQATRGDAEFFEAGSDMRKRTMWFCKHAFSVYRKLWVKSLELMGTAGYYGKIPPEAITRVSLISDGHALSYMSDPCVGIANHSIMGAYYRNLTRLAFLDKDDLEEDAYWLIRMDGELPSLDGIEVRKLR